MLLSHEVYVIKKGSQFIVGCPYDDTSYIRLSENKYDGYRDKDFNRMRRVAKQIDGRVMKFNPVTGEITGGWR